jgi:glyoxylase-like metal-dependent hydrolase (beta-lactamase superfamily II)
MTPLRCSTVRAASPAADTTVHRLALGNFEIHLIREAVYYWDGGALFGVVPKTLWSRKTQADALNRIPLAFNCYLVRTDEHQILIETGGGDKLDQAARARMELPPESRPLPEVISAAGFDPEGIDMVVNSHLHWDHCGGNTIRRGDTAVPAFPRATYYAPRGEWEHAHLRLSRDSVSYIDQNYDPLVAGGQMQLLAAGATEIAPGIRLDTAPGHTRDMMVVTVSSGGSTFCFLSDLVPTAAHLTPTWVTAFDLYPLETIENKTRWLGQAAAASWYCGFGHDCALGFARVGADKKSFRVLDGA